MIKRKFIAVTPFNEFKHLGVIKFYSVTKNVVYIKQQNFLHKTIVLSNFCINLMLTLPHLAKEQIV